MQSLAIFGPISPIFWSWYEQSGGERYFWECENRRYLQSLSKCGRAQNDFGQTLSSVKVHQDVSCAPILKKLNRAQTSVQSPPLPLPHLPPSIKQRKQWKSKKTVKMLLILRKFNCAFLYSIGKSKPKCAWKGSQMIYPKSLHMQWSVIISNIDFHIYSYLFLYLVNFHI